MTASLLSSQLGDGKQFSCSRDFAASTGLVPRQHSIGGKSTLLGISKRGDKNLRRLLVQCARSFMMQLERQHGKLAEWVREQLNKKLLIQSGDFLPQRIAFCLQGRFVMFTHSLVSTVADNFIFPFIQYRTTDTNTPGDFTD